MVSLRSPTASDATASKPGCSTRRPRRRIHRSRPLESSQFLWRDGGFASSRSSPRANRYGRRAGRSGRPAPPERHRSDRIAGNPDRRSGFGPRREGQARRRSGRPRRRTRLPPVSFCDRRRRSGTRSFVGRRTLHDSCRAVAESAILALVRCMQVTGAADAFSGARPRASPPNGDGRTPPGRNFARAPPLPPRYQWVRRESRGEAVGIAEKA